MAGVTDWYAKLCVTPTATEDEVRAAVEALSRKATAMANTAPERSQGLREQVRQMKAALLSGPAERAAYDATLTTTSNAPTTSGATVASPQQPGKQAALHQVQPPAQPPASSTRSQPASPAGRPAGGTWGSKFKQFLQTGWSCPTCGDGALPNERTCRRCGTDIPQPALVTERGVPQHSLQQLVQDIDTEGACSGCGAAMGLGGRFCTRCGKPQSQS